jgi:hypothetical protein
VSQYSSDLDSFLEDYLLIFDNCRAYNETGSPLYRAADALTKTGRELFDELFADSSKHLASQSSKTDGKKDSNKKRRDSEDVSTKRASLGTAGNGSEVEVDEKKKLKEKKKKLVEFLDRIEAIPQAEPFKYPVNLAATPGYLDVVDRPMDLSTLRKNVSQYSSDLDSFLEDYLLIFDNCRAYNETGSPLYRAADTLTKTGRELFEEIVKSEKLVPEKDNDFCQLVKFKSSTGKRTQKSFEEEVLSSLSSSDLLHLTEELQQEDFFNVRVLREICHKYSSELLQANEIPFNVESYSVTSFGEIVRNSANFHTINSIYPVDYSCTKRLKLHLLKQQSRLSNRKSDNKSTTEHEYIIVEFKSDIKRITSSDIPLFRVTIGDNILVGESDHSPLEAWKCALSSPPEAILSALCNKLRRCLAVLNRLCISPNIVPFLEELEHGSAVGNAYYSVIKSPMWIREIHQRLTDGIYDNEFDFAWDVRLVFTNCMEYNMKDSELYRDAEELLALFERLFCNWVVNVRDQSIHNLAKGSWDDWMHLNYFDKGDSDEYICCLTNTKGNAKTFVTCSMCEDIYSPEAITNILHDTLPQNKKIKWKCKRCKLALEQQESKEGFYPTSEYRNIVFKTSIYEPASDCSVDFMKNISISGWYVASQKIGKGHKFKCISPLGYECNSSNEVLKQIEYEENLHKSLLQDRELEYNTQRQHLQKSKRSVAKKRSKNNSTKSASLDQNPEKSTVNNDESWLTVGKLCSFQSSANVSYVWTELCSTDSALHQNPESGSITVDTLSGCGYFGVDDMDIRKLIEGMEGVLESCLSYQFIDSTVIKETLLNLVQSTDKIKHIEENAQKRFSELIRKEKMYWRNLEEENWKNNELCIKNTEFESTLLNNTDPILDLCVPFYHPCINGINEVNSEDMLLAMNLCEFFYYGRKVFGYQSFGVVEILIAIQPVLNPMLASPGHVVFDELCCLFTSVLLSSFKSPEAHLCVADLQNKLSISPINMLTWPKVMYYGLQNWYMGPRTPASMVDVSTRFDKAYCICMDLSILLISHSFIGYFEDISKQLHENVIKLKQGELPFDTVEMFVANIEDMLCSASTLSILQNSVEAASTAKSVIYLLRYALQNYRNDGLIESSDFLASNMEISALCHLEDSVPLECCNEFLFLLSNVLRVLWSKEPDLYTREDRRSVFKVFIQIASETSSFAESFHDAHREIDASTTIDRNPEKTAETLELRMKEFISNLEEVQLPKKTKSTSAAVCYFSGVDAKFTKDDNEWIYVPQSLMQDPIKSINESDSVIVNELKAPDSNNENNNDTTESKKRKCHSSSKYYDTQTTADVLSKPVCLKTVAIAIATARESAAIEWELNEVIIFITLSVFYLYYSLFRYVFVCTYRLYTLMEDLFLMTDLKPNAITS